MNLRSTHHRSFAAWFEPLAGFVWIFFLIWSAIGFVVMPLEISETNLPGWVQASGLRDAAVCLLRASDAIWIVLAAINIYFHTVQAEGLTVARRWAAIVLIGSTCLEWVGATTGWPFGPYRYTDHFGCRVGGVLPFTIPLAWLIIVLCGRYITLAVFPFSSRWQVSLGTACVALFTDCNLEFVAWKVRAYWIWYPQLNGTVPNWPPLQNYLSWFVFSFVFAFVLPPHFRLRLKIENAKRPVIILLVMNILFVGVHLMRIFHTA